MPPLGQPPAQPTLLYQQQVQPQPVQPVQVTHNDLVRLIQGLQVNPTSPVLPGLHVVSLGGSEMQVEQPEEQPAPVVVQVPVPRPVRVRPPAAERWQVVKTCACPWSGAGAGEGPTGCTCPYGWGPYTARSFAAEGSGTLVHLVHTHHGGHEMRYTLRCGGAGAGAEEDEEELFKCNREGLFCEVPGSPGTFRLVAPASAAVRLPIPDPATAVCVPHPCHPQRRISVCPLNTSCSAFVDDAHPEYDVITVGDRRWQSFGNGNVVVALAGNTEFPVGIPYMYTGDPGMYMPMFPQIVGFHSLIDAVMGHLRKM